MITQIITFSLNLGTSSKNFQTTKYSLERSFLKKLEYQKKFFFSKFFSKTVRSNLKNFSTLSKCYLTKLAVLADKFWTCVLV